MLAILGDVMRNRSKLRTFVVLACAVTLALSGGSAFAQHGGDDDEHGDGGEHRDGDDHRGEREHRFAGDRDDEYRGDYSWRDDDYDDQRLRFYFGALPVDYSTIWWHGVPYYYANSTYYQYDAGVGQYVIVAPPPTLRNRAEAQEPAGTDIIAYPKNGQTAAQQAKDKYECHHWATIQSGFDPTLGATATATAAQRSDYMRAQAACLDGRGYSVK
jgi:hypothetical protein